MRKFMVYCLLSLLALAATAQAQTERKEPVTERKEPVEEPVSAADTVRVSVHKAPGEHQFRLDFFVVNTEPVAGMPTPVRVSSKKAKLVFDSVSYVDGRVEYFQLKTQNADADNQTLLIGLIADLSGSKPPLAPGRGNAFSAYYTADKAIGAADVSIEPVLLAPANKMEFNTILADGQIGSTIPTFVRAKEVVEKEDTEK
jgi:hypothetical protein